MTPRWLSGATVVVSLLVGAAVASASTTVGTRDQVASAVKASVAIHSIPADLTPSLAQVSAADASWGLQGLSLLGACNPYQSYALRVAPVPCNFGDVTSSKVIVLIGDSNAGNWVPALALGLSRSGYRLAVFPYPGCGPADIHYTHLHQANGTTPQDCNLWHKHLPRAIRALHPMAVIAVAAAWRASTGTAGAQWVAGMKKMFEEATLHSPTTLRILLGTSPAFREHVPACLTANPDPQTCAQSDAPNSTYGRVLAQDELIAKTSHATLIPVEPWLCYDGSCSPVIGKDLVYVDDDHISTAYSLFTSRVVTEALEKVLKAG